MTSLQINVIKQKHVVLALQSIKVIKIVLTSSQKNYTSKGRCCTENLWDKFSDITIIYSELKRLLKFSPFNKK